MNLSHNDMYKMLCSVRESFELTGQALDRLEALGAVVSGTAENDLRHETVLKMVNQRVARLRLVAQGS